MKTSHTLALSCGWLLVSTAAPLTPALSAQTQSPPQVKEAPAPHHPAPGDGGPTEARAGHGDADGVTHTHGDGVTHAQGHVMPPRIQPPTYEPVPYPDDGKNVWFPKTKLHLGTFYQEELARGSFPFKNATAKEQQLSNFLGSCQCARAEIHVGDRLYELSNEPVKDALHRIVREGDNVQRERVTHIVVGPHEEGHVDVFLKMAGIVGEKEATVDLQTTDPQLPHVKLLFKGLGATYFVVNPPDVNLNEMGWNDKREFSFEVTSPLRKDFEITGHEPWPEKMQVEYEKEMRDGRAVWKVKGTYGPGVDERSAGGTLTFKTDVDGKTATTRVVAFVKGPLTMEPGGFVSLGAVREGNGASAEIKIVPNDTFDLQVTSLDVQGLMVPKDGDDKLQITSVKDGNGVKVKIEVLPGMPRGVMRGTIKINLNHPVAPLKEVMFNGFVR